MSASSSHSHLLYLYWVMNKINLTCSDTEWFCRRNLPQVGGWPNSTLAKDLSESAITVIAQFTFWLIYGVSMKGEYLHYIQKRSCAQLRQHSVYSHLTDCCPRTGLTGRVQRERNVMRGGSEWSWGVAKTKTKNKKVIFLKLGVMQQNGWMGQGVQRCGERKRGCEERMGSRWYMFSLSLNTDSTTSTLQNWEQTLVSKTKT